MSTLIHLGSGKIHLAGWINIDHEPSHNPDVCMDYLQLHTRFAENSADAVLAVHTIEHLEFASGVQTVLEQMFRVLKPSGVVRIVVPDLMLVAKKYVNGEDLKDIYTGPGEYYLGEIDCPATRFAYFCRAWSHTVIFDFRLLFDMMKVAGFVNIRGCNFGQSDTPALCGVDRFPAESLSMEGTKP